MLLIRDIKEDAKSLAHMYAKCVLNDEPDFIGNKIKLERVLINGTFDKYQDQQFIEFLKDLDTGDILFNKLNSFRESNENELDVYTRLLNYQNVNKDIDGYINGQLYKTDYSTFSGSESANSKLRLEKNEIQYPTISDEDGHTTSLPEVMSSDDNDEKEIHSKIRKATLNLYGVSCAVNINLIHLCLMSKSISPRDGVTRGLLEEIGVMSFNDNTEIANRYTADVDNNLKILNDNYISIINDYIELLTKNKIIEGRYTDKYKLTKEIIAESFGDYEIAEPEHALKLMHVFLNKKQNRGNRADNTNKVLGALTSEINNPEVITQYELNQWLSKYKHKSITTEYTELPINKVFVIDSDDRYAVLPRNTNNYLLPTECKGGPREYSLLLTSTGKLVLVFKYEEQDYLYFIDMKYNWVVILNAIFYGDEKVIIKTPNNEDSERGLNTLWVRTPL